MGDKASPNAESEASEQVFLQLLELHSKIL